MDEQIGDDEALEVQMLVSQLAIEISNSQQMLLSEIKAKAVHF